MGRNYSNRNLTNLELSNIEFYLNSNKSPMEISILMKRDESTIRKEVKKFSTHEGGTMTCQNCLNRSICNQKFLCSEIYDEDYCSNCKDCPRAIANCPNYDTITDCKLLKKYHHVCNGCEVRYRCKKVKTKYVAKKAIQMHKAVKQTASIGTKVDIFPDEFKKYLSKLIKNGISPEVIMNTLPIKYSMYKSSVSSFYEWIDKGLLDCCNLDLRNQVSRKKHNKESEKRNTVSGHQLNGRSVENLTEEEFEDRPLGFVELDTVEGIKGKELLFTIMIPCFSLMLGYKIPNKTSEEVVKILDMLEEKLGINFYIIFRKSIPDNGSEFLDFDAIEKSIHPEIGKRTQIFYTHANAPFEKPHIENNHILLRWLIAKGVDISVLSADEVLNIINRLNNYPRAKKNFKTPLQLLEEQFGKEILKELNLHHIPIDKLNMKDMIFKK